jgi:hypothetical protein
MQQHEVEEIIDNAMAAPDLNESDKKLKKAVVALLEGKLLGGNINSNLSTETICSLLESVQVRDYLLWTMYKDAPKRVKFFEWWNIQLPYLSRLDDSLKANALNLMAGVLLLNGDEGNAKAAAEVSLKYKNTNFPNLILVAVNQVSGTGGPGTGTKVFLSSMGDIKEDEILS